MQLCTYQSRSKWKQLEHIKLQRALDVLEKPSCDLDLDVLS